MNGERRRVAGWVIVLLMAAFVAGIGVAIYFGIRPDPSLPRAPMERVPHDK